MGRITTIISLLAVIISGCTHQLQAPVYGNKPIVGTANPTIAIIGDTQRTGIVEVWRERNDAERERLLRQLASQSPSALMHLGDMVFYGSSDADWEYFDNAMEPIRSKQIPVYPVLGNHEYFGSDEAMLQAVRQRFPTFRSLWYSVVIDSIAFVMLNTNYGELGGKEMGRQQAWFQRTIAEYEVSPEVQYIVVCGHHPPFTNSTVVSDEEPLQMYFVPTFMLAQKTTVWFSGHCHAYEHFYMGNKHFVVSGGGGGPRQRVRIPPYDEHLDMYDAPMLRPFHYCMVQRDSLALNVTMVPLQAKSVRADSFSIRKRDVGL